MYPPEWFRWDLRPREIKRPEWFTQWPSGARVAVQLTIMHEWESTPREWSPAYGRRFPPDSVQKTDFMSLTYREYAFKAGIWRIMNILDENKVKVTVLTNGVAAEVWPDSLRELKRQGHEIGSHAYDQRVHPVMHKSREEEREDLRKSIKAIQQAVGERPYGYMSPGPRPTVHTLELLAEEGFVWAAEFLDADIPYVIDVKGKKLIILCWMRPGLQDTNILGSGGFTRSPSEALTSLKDEFNAVYEESAVHPMRFNYCVHSYLSGTPGAASVIRDFIRYAQDRSGVWFATGMDQATFWLEHDK